jgi:hypothetical protein
MKLAPLIAIEVVAFLLIIAETYAFFVFIVPLGSVPHNFLAYTGLALFKLILTFGLGLLWFVMMIVLTNAYVRARFGLSTPTPLS